MLLYVTILNIKNNENQNYYFQYTTYFQDCQECLNFYKNLLLFNTIVSSIKPSNLNKKKKIIKNNENTKKNIKTSCMKIKLFRGGSWEVYKFQKGRQEELKMEVSIPKCDCIHILFYFGFCRASRTAKVTCLWRCGVSAPNISIAYGAFRTSNTASILAQYKCPWTTFLQQKMKNHQYILQ